jgi:sulfatase maturation enzyme AslB (radical SAM superfamily)
MRRLEVVVSVDGLQPEHDVRRTPATYARILKHINGQHVTVHCTLMRQHARRGYVAEFVRQWASNPSVKRIWFSMYTPQRGEDSPERLRAEDRDLLAAEITALHASEPKLHDMKPGVVARFLRPPRSPAECIFARTTDCLSADLDRPITPCQFGGDPDCSQCGCMAAVGLAALADYRLANIIPLRVIFGASLAAGAAARRLRTLGLVRGRARRTQ